MKVDILAFGAHPDDVELSCSGTIISEIKKGKKVAIVDLTEGELGSRGTVETRYQEATAAAIIMGVHARENLKLQDGFFQNEQSSQLKLIAAIRKYQPSIVLANALNDRHPDHGKAGRLIADSCFLAGLSKVVTQDADGKEQSRWRPSYVLHYIQDRLHEPNIVIDISDVFEQRMQAILAYKTQFFDASTNANEPQTYISSPEFLEGLKSRTRLMGKRIGVMHAEGFTSEKSIGIKGFDSLIQNET